jgi:hypothetical protein
MSLPLDCLVAFIPIAISRLQVTVWAYLLSESHHQHFVTEFHGLMPCSPTSLAFLRSRWRAAAILPSRLIDLDRRAGLSTIWVHAEIVQAR